VCACIRLCVSLCVCCRKLTSNYVSKLWLLNNEFFSMRESLHSPPHLLFLPFIPPSRLLQTLILTGKEGIIEAVTTLRPLQPQPNALSPPGCKASPGAGGAHAATLDSSLSEGGNGGGSAVMHFDSAQGQNPQDRSIFGFTTMLVKQPIFHER